MNKVTRTILALGLAFVGTAVLVGVIETSTMTPEERAAAQAEREKQAEQRRLVKALRDEAKREVAAAKEAAREAERMLRNAKDICQTFVTRRLRAPSTAKFPYYHQIDGYKQSDGVYRITSYVDAQNGFGAMIRSNYDCKAIPVDGDTWKLVKLTM